MITRFFKYLRWLSLDVTAGAIVLLAFLCREFGIQLTLSEFVALGLSVFLIYNIDHLRDARQVSENASERRLFHKRNSKLIRNLVVLLAIVGLEVLFYLDQDVLVHGSLMVVSSVLYLFIFSRIHWAKELWVAIMYAFGTHLIPILRGDGEYEVWFSVIAVAVLAFVNLVLISLHETEQDKSEGFQSMVTTWGKPWTFGILILSFAVLLGLAILLWMIDLRNISILMGLSWIVYLIVWISPDWIQRNERYRWMSDIVFIFPIVTLI